jgi:hypothetical protein
MPFTNREISETDSACGIQVGEEKCVQDSFKYNQQEETL